MITGGETHTWILYFWRLVDLLSQVLPGSRNVRHVFVQDILLGADAVVLNVLGPVQLAHIKVKCLQIRWQKLKILKIETENKKAAIFVTKSACSQVFSVLSSVAVVHDVLSSFTYLQVEIPLCTEKVMDSFLESVLSIKFRLHVRLQKGEFLWKLLSATRFFFNFLNQSIKSKFWVIISKCLGNEKFNLWDNNLKFQLSPDCFSPSVA